MLDSPRSSLGRPAITALNCSLRPVSKAGTNQREVVTEWAMPGLPGKVPEKHVSNPAQSQLPGSAILRAPTGTPARRNCEIQLPKQGGAASGGSENRGQNHGPIPSSFRYSIAQEIRRYP
jgi:hypothetical protein